MHIAGKRGRLMLGVAGLLTLSTAQAGWSQATTSRFAELAGSWTGSGQVQTTNGREPIRCRVDYEVTPTGAGLHQKLRCASDSFRFEVNSSLVDEGGAIGGTWAETTRNVTGQFTGRMRGGEISGTVAGTGFTATLSVATSADSQTVIIRPQGATDVREVSVKLRRS